MVIKMKKKENRKKIKQKKESLRKIKTKMKKRKDRRKKLQRELKFKSCYATNLRSSSGAAFSNWQYAHS